MRSSRHSTTAKREIALFDDSLTARAGIARMEKGAYDYAWNLFNILSIYLLIRPACIELTENRKQSWTVPFAPEKRKLFGDETIRMISPISLLIGTPMTRQYWHTIVPRQIEDAVTRVFGTVRHKVYGDFWVLPSNVAEGSEEWFNARDQAVALAEAQYEYKDDSDVEEFVLPGEPDWQSSEQEFSFSDEESGEWSDAYDDDIDSSEDEDSSLSEEDDESDA